MRRCSVLLPKGHENITECRVKARFKFSAVSFIETRVKMKCDNKEGNKK